MFSGKVVVIFSAFALRSLMCFAQNSQENPFTVTCEPGVMSISAPSSFYGNDVKLSDLHLSDFSCGGDSGPDGKWEFSTVSLSSCSTVLTSNKTHLTYSNILSNVVQSERVYTGTVFYTYFSCSYNSSLKHLSLPASNTPVHYGVTRTLANNTAPSAQGEISASMNLYTDVSHATLQPERTFRTVDTMYILIELFTTEATLNVVIEKCWVTPTPSVTYRYQYTFIENKCPVTNGIPDHVQITRNGQGHIAHFQSQVFAFIDYDTTYIHCSVEICSSESGNNCAPTCPTRRRRSVSDDANSARVGQLSDDYSSYGRGIVSLGPFTIQRENVAKPSTDFPYVAVFSTILVVLVAMVAILLLIVYRNRRRYRNHRSGNLAIASSAVVEEESG